MPALKTGPDLSMARQYHDLGDCCRCRGPATGVLTAEDGRAVASCCRRCSEILLQYVPVTLGARNG